MPEKTPREIADSVTLEWDSDLFPTLREILGAISQQSGDDVLRALGFESADDIFATVAESTLNEAAARAADLVGKRILSDGRIVDSPDPKFAITESTREMIYETLNDAFGSGLSAGAIRDEIINSYGFSAQRALNIARTERSFAQQRGGLRAALDSGVVKGKRCVLASEHDADDICDEAEADGVIPVDEDFSPGGNPPFH
jgi:hypothetical protein